MSWLFVSENVLGMYACAWEFFIIADAILCCMWVVAGFSDRLSDSDSKAHISNHASVMIVGVKIGSRCDLNSRIPRTLCGYRHNKYSARELRCKVLVYFLEVMK